MRDRVGLRREARRALLHARERWSAALSSAARPFRPATDAHVPLEATRRRLELVLAALYGRAFVIDAAHERKRGLIARVTKPDHDSRASTDGHAIVLPAAIDARGATIDPNTHYRILALQQAERITRGTVAVASQVESPIVRDLFLVAEGAAADARVVELSPSLAADVRALQSLSLQQRASRRDETPAEGSVERLLRAALGASEDATIPVPQSSSAAESLVWATAVAATLDADATTYRGIEPAMHWGRITIRDSGAAIAKDAPQQQKDWSPLPIKLVGRASEGATGEGEQAQKPTASEDAEPQMTEVTRRGGREGEEASSARPPDLRSGVAYPEWNCETSSYLQRHALVTEAPLEEGELRWSAHLLAVRAPLVRQVRQRFERLKAQRLRLPRQVQGDELDVMACVDSLVERAAGRSGADRLYIDVRPARRELAIAVLVDVSGSTSERVHGDARVIDVEQVALLLASEALDAIGDRYALLTFSSRGARDVSVGVVKDFAERNGDTVRRRMAAVAPGNNTRLGAAVRHASALLSRQPAGHRLLLVLSDGQPNDTDGYHAPYSVEDARQSVNEARANGVHTFCLTIDREDPVYAERIFGPTGFTVLMDPEQLPTALLGAVRSLLTR